MKDNLWFLPRHRVAFLTCNNTAMASEKTAKDAKAAPSDGKDAPASSTSPTSTPDASNIVNTVQTDVAHNLTLLRSAVSLLEPRLTTKVIRTTASVRARLDASSLRDIVDTAFPKGGGLGRLYQTE